MRQLKQQIDDRWHSMEQLVGLHSKDMISTRHQMNTLAKRHDELKDGFYKYKGFDDSATVFREWDKIMTKIKNTDKEIDDEIKRHPYSSYKIDVLQRHRMFLMGQFTTLAGYFDMLRKIWDDMTKIARDVRK